MPLDSRSSTSLKALTIDSAASGDVLGLGDDGNKLEETFIEDGVDLSKLFQKSGKIVALGEIKFDFSSVSVWRHCFLRGKSYE